MFYDRKIKYLELFEKGMKLQGAGFVKLEIRDKKVNMVIRVDKLNLMDNITGKVLLKGNDEEAFLGEINLKAGKGALELLDLSYDNIGADIGYGEVEELIIMLQPGRELRCRLAEKGIMIPKQKEVTAFEELEALLSRQSDTEVTIASFPMQSPELGQNMEPPLQTESAEERRKEPEQQPLALQMKREERTDADCVQKGHPIASNKWQQLCNRYPHIHPFEDNREYLQINPEDFVILTKECFSLSANSFLLHGYYNYEHLILMKELQEGRERYYVGVPGNFYIKEKQVAVLYGFESFEGKTEPAKNGDFGYYMISVEL